MSVLSRHRELPVDFVRPFSEIQFTGNLCCIAKVGMRPEGDLRRDIHSSSYVPISGYCAMGYGHSLEPQVVAKIQRRAPVATCCVNQFTTASTGGLNGPVLVTM